MARKPGSMYRYIKQQSNIRKENLGVIPHSRITQYISGNKKGNLPIRLLLYVKESFQIRHTVLESDRVTANRTIEKKAGPSDYRIIIRVFPHEILRENKQATGAGADRVTQGFRQSFDKIVGTAARVKANQTVISVETFEKNIRYAKEAIRKASSKLPSPCKIKLDW